MVNENPIPKNYDSKMSDSKISNLINPKSRRSDAQHYSPHVRQQLDDAQLLSLHRPDLETVSENALSDTSSEGAQSFHLEFSLDESQLNNSIIITSENSTVIARKIENVNINQSEAKLTSGEIVKMNDIELRKELRKYKVIVPPVLTDGIRQKFRDRLRKCSQAEFEYSEEVGLIRSLVFYHMLFTLNILEKTLNLGR